MARIGYARVSSLDQDLTAQLAKLELEGSTIVRSEKVSGASGEGRPELATVLQFLRAGDELVVTGSIVWGVILIRLYYDNLIFNSLWK